MPYRDRKTLFIKPLFIYLLIFVCFILSPAAAHGAGQAGAGGLTRVKSARYAAASGVETVTITIEKYEGVHSFYLQEPGRFVIDIKGAEVPPGQHAAEIGKGSVARVRCGMFDKQTARFVIDLSKYANFIVKTGKGFIKAEAATGAGDAAPILFVPGEGNVTADGRDVASESPAQSGGERLANANAGNVNAGNANTGNTNAGNANAGDGGGSGGNANTGDGGGNGGGGENNTAGTAAAPKRTPRPTRAPRATPARVPRATPRRSPQPTPTPAPGGYATPSPIVAKDEFRFEISRGLRIAFTAKGGENKLTIDTPPGLAEKAKITLQDGDPRLAVDIPYAPAGGITGPKSLAVNMDVLKNIGVSQPDANTIRISLYIRPRVGAESVKEGDKITIRLKNEFIPNAGYYKNGERAFLTLYQTALTYSGENFEKYYTSASKDGGKVWAVTFANDRGALGAGEAKINDSLLQSVAISKTGAATTLTVTAKEPVRLVIYTKQEPNINYLETTVSIVRPAAGAEQVVVIDAGHGGHVPGAISANGVCEKDIVLDIALKLKERLSQKEGLRVFMTRDADYYVDLYERAELANELNATLFVSVHANASDSNPDANGIETLYYAVSPDAGFFTDRHFAELTQRTLISQLKMTDRGIVERPKLVVLNSTKMPAILVETAFLTNSADLLSLTRSAYRKNAAKAICDSIIEALDLIKRNR